MANRRRSSFVPLASELQLAIGILTLIKVAKYAPHIAFAFATVNLALAILEFSVWGNLAFGLINNILAVGGFVFVGQLLPRRVTRVESDTARERLITDRMPEVEPRMNAESNNQSFKHQEAA